MIIHFELDIDELDSMSREKKIQLLVSKIEEIKRIEGNISELYLNILSSFDSRSIIGDRF